MIESLESLIKIETRKAIKAIIESKMSSGDQERDRQERQSDLVSKRGLQSSDNPDKKEEAESDENEKDEKQTAKEEPKDGKREDRTKGRGTADSPKIKDPKKDQLKNPTVSDVVDKLNALRGGRSLKDPEVRKSFAQYYEGLTTPERQSLVVFLTGIAQVLAGAEAGAEAIDPGDVGLRVKTSSEKPEEDTSEPKSKEGTTDNPIVVGEVASKLKIKKALKEYSKY